MRREEKRREEKRNAVVVHIRLLVPLRLFSSLLTPWHCCCPQTQVISARKGEFETGFERGGQTREHAMLAKTAGVKHLIVAINKMDEPTVKWSQARFDECQEKLSPYLRQTGFKKEGAVDFTVSICGWELGEFFLGGGD